MKISFLIPIFARWLHTVCLGLWLGGVIVIGAIVAPSAFHVVSINSVLALNKPLQTTIAAGIIGESLRKFNVLSDACAVGMLVAGVLLFKHGGDSRRARLVAAGGIVLTAVALIITFYLQFTLFPAMDLAQSQGNTALFDALHHRYVRLSVIQCPLLLLVALCAVVRGISMPAARA